MKHTMYSRMEYSDSKYVLSENYAHWWIFACFIKEDSRIALYEECIARVRHESQSLLPFGTSLWNTM